MGGHVIANFGPEFLFQMEDESNEGVAQVNEGENEEI